MTGIVEVIDGRRVSLDDVDGGVPTVLFVHGGLCDRHDWQAQVAALAPRSRTVCVDLPGHGESEVPLVGRIDVLANALAAIKDRRGGDVAVLVGHSVGCSVILETYRRSPDGIGGLLLIEGGRRATSDPDLVVGALRDDLSTVGFEAWVTATFGAMFTPDSDPAVVRRTIDRALRMDRAFAEEVLVDSVRWGISEAPAALAAVRVPTMVLQADRSGTDWTDLVAHHVERADIRVMPGGGHFPHVEAATTVSDAIVDLIERVSAASGSAAVRA